MDRESFFNRAVKTKDVTLDDGQTVKVAKLSQADVETLRRDYSKDDKNLAGLRFVVVKTVVDDAGHRTFTDSDIAKLAELDFETVQTLATAAMEFSGLAVPKNT